MKNGIALAFVLALLGPFALAQATMMRTGEAAAATSTSAAPSVEPLPDDELSSSCFLTCTNTCVADYCNGLPPDVLQQCSNDCAEGCACMCGVPWPSC
jgi:hypothetical protein